MLEFPVRPAALRECADRISGLLPALAMELHRKASRANRAEVVVDRLLSGRRSVDAG